MTLQEFQDRYRFNVLEDKIGGGGFGEVYKGRDTYEEEDVAIKISPVKRIGDKTFSLKDELETAKALPAHRNIAVYKHAYQFVMPNGVYDYATMRYYPDGNLKDVFQKKLTSTQKADIADQLLAGVAHLHKHKVLHRDLKPANILIHKEGRRYIPKIADFGLSKLSESDGSRISNSFGGGTLEYSAPEQLLGKELRYNADLWALGVILYELFKGVRPFRADSNTGSAEAKRQAIYDKIIKAPLPDLSGIPDKYRSIIERSLVSNPEQRVRTVAALYSGATPQSDTGSEATEVQGRTSRSSGKSQKPKTEKSDRDKKSPWLWYVLGGLAVALLGGYFLMNRSDPSPSPEPIVEKELRADSLAYTQLDLEDKAALSAFIKEYKEGEYVGMAQTVLDKIEKDKAANDKREAQEKEDLAAWNEAKRKDTKSSYESYERKYPRGKYIKEARSKINSIEEADQRAREAIAEVERRKAEEKAKEVNSNLSPIIRRLEKNMVRVEGGEFAMGCRSEQEYCNADEKPTHKVTLDDYFIGRYEVTQEEWRAVMGRDSEKLKFKGCARCPVERVSWHDVQEFITKLNKLTGKRYRLPTEAEWEYAARGGKKSKGYKYSGSDDVAKVAWYDGNSASKTHEVGKKAGNELNLYDMNGNVWEWCSDRYDSDYYKTSKNNNPKGPVSGYSRVLRGGSWNYRGRNCRVSIRDGLSPRNRLNYLGFRLSRT